LNSETINSEDGLNKDKCFLTTSPHVTGPKFREQNDSEIASAASGKKKGKGKNYWSSKGKNYGYSDPATQSFFMGN
jgi:hypothetical protein